MADRNFIYIAECSDGSWYTGWTTDLQRRIRAHNSGRGARYTKSRRPVKLIYWEEYPTEKQARSREYEIKQLSRQEKEKLVRAAAGKGKEMSVEQFFDKVLSVRLTEDRRALDIIDQTLLPGTIRRIRLETKEEIWEAIKKLRVRGAPAIGVTAAFGIYLLTIENSSISKIQIFDSGSFVYRNDSLLFTLEYINAEGYPATYNCSFSGVLIPWLKR